MDARDSNDFRDMPPDASPDPALVIAATMYLMSCHSCHPCPRLAGMIKRHLCALASLDLPPVLKTTCRQLCGKWDQLATPAEPPSLFASFVAGSTRTH